MINIAVDPSNGAVQVLTYEIKRGVWLRLIYRTIEVLRKHLLPRFCTTALETIDFKVFLRFALTKINDF